MLENTTLLCSGNDEILRERERENAATFVRVLRNRVARLNTIRSGPEIDQKIQEFSAQFCQVGKKNVFCKKSF
jgi:hypothetical protein